MPKRKKLSGDDASDDGKRRRKVDLTEILQELYDTLRNHKTTDGRILCEAFIRAPKRRNLADYYDVVTTPMDLIRVQQKIKMDEYEDVEQMSADIELLINNAKVYYKKGSQEYNDANAFYDLFIDLKNDLFTDIKQEFDNISNQSQSGIDMDTLSNSESETTIEYDNLYEELFSSIMTATVDEGRSLSTMFELLPLKANYPDYYKIVSEPIDLKTIGSKILNNCYISLNELERDLLQMVRNAKLYNEPGSQIYKDANALRKIIMNKKNEIEQRKCQPIKISERIRAKRLLPAGQKWSAITAALKYENEMDLDTSTSANTSNYGDETINDDGNFSDPEDAETNPQWQLFEAIRSMTNAQGIAFSDPFMRLPSRRFYPDYYKEIKHPISLAKIRAKIKTGSYDNVTSLINDLNLTFQNAMKYNRPDSKIFKDALKLQKVLHVKAQELLNISTKYSDESESEDDSRSELIVKRSKPRKSLLSAMTHELKKARRSQLDIDSQLKKRMKTLYKTLIDYVEENGRSLILLFMEKPSRKTYPDYYEIIKNPIDMKTIENNIKWERYSSEEALLFDFRLMFSNCKQYNEDNSLIYKDAVTLENILMEKVRELGPFQPIKIKRTKIRAPNVIQHKLRTLYNTVKDYTDSKGRQLATIFMKLPLKTELPEYYDVIKKPLGLEKIGVKLKNGTYEALEDLLSDLILMLDNACKYNEPDSQIYKDALSLQQIALQTKVELCDDSSTGIPDIKSVVQELLTNLFVSVYNNQDEEGRCFSDSIIEFLETDMKSTENSEIKPLNFDMIKRNLDKGKYRRLDRFQRDMFEVFDRTRRMNRTDSQAFEDSLELQTFFIRLRNELCKNGEILSSSALKYSEEDLIASVDALRREKLPKEQDLDGEEETKPDEKETEENLPNHSPLESNDVIFQDNIYRVGDFVYIEPREKTTEPHIIHIQKLQRDENGSFWIYGCWFFRPFETFHIASKRFLEKEVFKSDSCNSTPLNQVVGKCYVMFVKDYFRHKPENFEDKDVYVCESRYFTRAKTFKKIKVWPYIQNVPFITRENAIPMIRIPSVFKDQTEKLKEQEEEEDDLGPKILDIERTNVICITPEGVYDCSLVFYEQYTIPSGSYKLGDCCYVRTDQGRNLICRIDRMWVDRDGNSFFHGPWFVQQQELPPLTIKSFYPQEVFLSSIEDTNPLLSICDRCAVLEYKDYITRRPTEMLEKDVYVCESRYLEHEKKFQKLSKGLTKFTYANPRVTEDEIYFFRRHLTLQRIESGLATTAVARKGQSISDVINTCAKHSVETENEESNDQASMGSDHHVPAPTPPVKKKLPKRLVTGYIIFASEVRKSVVQANPECSFGDVSRIIGTEWKNLPPLQKGEYEQKAQRQNEETAKEAAAAAAAENLLPHSPAVAHSTHVENGVYECHWENKCDYQFEDSCDLLDHLVSESNGHVWQVYGENKDKEGTEFQCMFHGCGRVKKGAAPFPSIQRLMRHCKEVHVTKQTLKSVAPENRSKNFIQSRKNISQAPVTITTTTTTVNSQQTAPQMTISNSILQSRSTPSPALSISESNTTISMSALHPTLSQAIGNNNQLSTIMPVLSPFWASGTGVQVKPVEPLFVAIPPRTNRLLHTHTYMKYIEKLRPDCRHVSNWQTQLNATHDNIPQTDVVSRLPTNWLANGAGNHGNVVNALWALRNFMMKDALNISLLNQN